ncbi:DUF1127 domain-containing protein [Pseudaestuariivita rosea]|uniref:DUF1127 domain-containing protein n=1 Tax=Pseudaestuariivita rosea TaxID=2763263 RepID=UPI001ABA2B9E|nr:DUF1127 domain-containing protein [Pseudaestuariivita rosea]
MAYITEIHHFPKRRHHSIPSLRQMLAVMKSRRELAKLSDYELKDIGLTRAEATKEARRPFWDIA